jgi:hypothetical protein
MRRGPRIGVNARTISRWFKEEAFAGAYRAQATELQLELWNHILAMRSEAWGRFRQLLNSDDERIALRATFWALDRMLQVPAIVSVLSPQVDGLGPAIPARLRAFLAASEAPPSGDEHDVA